MSFFIVMGSMDDLQPENRRACFLHLYNKTSSHDSSCSLSPLSIMLLLLSII